MRTITITLLLLSVLNVHALNIVSSSWYNGALVFDTERLSNGSVRMYATTEGEELEFLLAPVENDVDTYIVMSGPNEHVTPYEEGMTVKHINEEGLEVLCFYNKKNLLHTVMTRSSGEYDNQEINIHQWMELLKGTYTTEDGTEVIFDRDNLVNVGGVLVPAKPVTFN